MVMGLNKETYCYHVSYVAIGSRFGNATVFTDKRITRKSYSDVTKAMKEEIEKTSDYKQVVILNFQELDNE
ncbi:MAG: hypothetical protein FVQ78_10020 [Solirubrobacterales bacterium]|nr:hypothetical protein [Solirubrobacterales bacterium]